MDMKFEIEELEIDYDSYDHYPQIFPDTEAKFASSYSINVGELFETIYIKEFEEIKEESLLDEDQINNDVLKTEMIGRLSPQHVKIFFTLKNVSSLSKKIAENGSEVQFESDEEEFFGNLLMSKFPCVKLNKLTDNEIKSLIGVTNPCEQGSKAESSGSRPLMSVTFDQAVRMNCQDYFSCRFCFLAFGKKNELKRHLKTHDKRKRKFKCAHCNYQGNQKGNLKAHLLTHSNSKLFKCSECSHECNFKSGLKSHLQTHSNSKKQNPKIFKCSECSYECYLKNSLKFHLLTHSNLKQFIRVTEKPQLKAVRMMKKEILRS